uniref:Nucleotide-diphospho-sugar transferase domain-containing protein n=1 Tax=Calcidiscus leptoporus TaxID=127549 RepID=A0A7S0J9T8_9EUKA
MLAFKWRVLAQLLSQGFGVLYTDPSTVLVSDPFEALYRDADIEAMSLGWDDPSSYGYNHVIDDPSMGFTRFCHGSRIVGYEPSLFFASPTPEALALASRMQAHAAAESLSSASRWEMARLEREAFLSELWMPSHKLYVSTGAIVRVLNYMCFVNSKFMFRQLRHDKLSSVTPVLVTINYHTDVERRMQAVFDRYHEHNKALLQALPLADNAGDPSQSVPANPCDGARSWMASAEANDLAKRAIAESPWAWGGVAGFEFARGGELRTPWGAGHWGVHSELPDTLFADFVGSKHNLRFSHGVAVSNRCGDSNVVLLRSVKNANLRQ